MSTSAAAPPRVPPGLPSRPSRGLTRLPSLEQIRAKVAPSTSSPSLSASDGRPSVPTLPARPSSVPPHDAPASRSLLCRHTSSTSLQQASGDSASSSSTVLRPPLGGRRASLTAGPSLQAIRERVALPTIPKSSSMPVGLPRIILTPVDHRSSEASSSETAVRFKTSTGAATTMDEAQAQALKSQNLPLQHVWTWTYTPPMPTRTASSLDAYSSALVTFGELRTVQDWAQHVNHIPPLSTLAKGANYGLFRGGNQPVYEDVHHKEGGRWVLTLRGLSAEQSTAAIERCWSEVMMALVGGMLPTEGEVACTGAVVGIRHRGDRLQLWTTSKSAKVPIQDLGERLFLLLRPTLDGVRATRGGYTLDFQVNFPTSGGNIRFQGWNSDTASPLLPRSSSAGWR